MSSWFLPIALSLIITSRRNRIAEPRIRPLLYYHGGRILFNCSRYSLEGSKELIRAADLPCVSEVQREALDVIQSIAERHQVTLHMQPGDLTFINNFAMLHSRQAFEDDDVNSRYLVLLWLKNERLAWKLPRSLRLGQSHCVFRSRGGGTLECRSGAQNQFSSARTPYSLNLIITCGDGGSSVDD